jgi:hypothetical protein
VVEREREIGCDIVEREREGGLLLEPALNRIVGFCIYVQSTDRESTYSFLSHLVTRMAPTLTFPPWV